MADLGWVAVIREQFSHRVDQAKALVGARQQKHAAIGTDRAAIERGGDFLATNVWQRERKQRIVGGGGHGGVCPGLRDGVDNQSLSDSRWLHHARSRIPAMQ